MPRLDALTYGSMPGSFIADQAEISNPKKSSDIVESIGGFLDPAAFAADIEGCDPRIRDKRQKILADVAPALLALLQDESGVSTGTFTRIELDWRRRKIVLTEDNSGLQILDEKSGKSCTIPGHGYKSLMHALAAEITKNPQHYDTPAIELAEAVRAHTLPGLTAETRGEIVTHLGDPGVVALAQASKTFHDDAYLNAHVVKAHALTLMNRRGVGGLQPALRLMEALPTTYHLGLLQALAKHIETIHLLDRTAVFDAPSNKAADLCVAESRTFIATLATVVKCLSRKEQLRAWRSCFAFVMTARSVKPEDLGTALVALASSLVDCVPVKKGRQEYFSKILQALVELNSADPRLGRALAILATAVRNLDGKEAAFHAIRAAVVNLDKTNPNRDDAMTMLSLAATHVDEATVQEV